MEQQPRQSVPGKPAELQAVEAIEQGILHFEDGEADRAVEFFTEAIRLDPESAKAYRLRGHVYSKIGKWALAERDIAKARRAEARQP